MTTARGFGTWVVQAATLEQLSDSDILTALRALPKESQTLIYLADIKGLAYKEIAEITGMPAEVMASWLYQIRCRLGELAVGAAGRGSAASAFGNPSPPHRRPRRLAGWRRPGRLPGCSYVGSSARQLATEARDRGKNVNARLRNWIPPCLQTAIGLRCRVCPLDITGR